MMRVPDGKFSKDLLWNASAFALSALLGVLVNLLIVRFYDPAALGVFNLVYASYILLSQLAVGGVHLAIQAFVPRELAARVRQFVVEQIIPLESEFRADSGKHSHGPSEELRTRLVGLARSAGLVSPFDEGCLTDVVRAAEAEAG